MNIGINELGFGLAGVIAVLLFRSGWPALKQWWEKFTSSAPGGAMPTEPWWLKPLLEALKQLKEGYDFTITVKPRETPKGS